MSEDDDDDAAIVAVDAPLYVWIGLSVLAAISFWFQAILTEDRFVPALNTVAHAFHIPNDIAGATLMAAGASAPELFTSFVSLFITHSSLGLGTIVGSEIFNQLIICAGAVFAAKTVGLQLDPAIVTREVGFYALSILLLYLALQDKRPDPEDDESDVDHLYISFGDACYLLGGYMAYVAVCAKMDDIVAVCSTFRGIRNSDSQKELRKNKYGDAAERPSVRRVSLPHADDQKRYFLREQSLMTHEPVANFEPVAFYRTLTGDVNPDGMDATTCALSGYQIMDPNITSSVRSNFSDSGRSNTPRSPPMTESATQALSSVVSEGSAGTDFMNRCPDGLSLGNIEFMMHKSKPSDVHDMYDIELNVLERRLSCFMWQRSVFYSKARLATHGWHMRWFSFYPDKISSVPNRLNAEKHRMVYPIPDFVEIDERRMIIRLVNPKLNRRHYFLMAPSKDILDAVIKQFEDILEVKSASQETGGEVSVNETGDTKWFADEDHVGLLEYPYGSSRSAQLIFIGLYLFRFVLHWTVPDVQKLDSEGNPISKLSTAFVAIGMCLFWLIVGSYAMVYSLEQLADLMDVTPSLVGITVSAAGTSIPNYVASRIAAERGFGNMAVSNAFGSNTFNIMVGLGLPWLLYTSIGTGFQPYHGLRNEGILESVEILCAVLAVFVVVVLTSGFVLYRWHAVLFILLYIAYIAYEIARVYV